MSVALVGYNITKV